MKKIIILFLVSCLVLLFCSFRKPHHFHHSKKDRFKQKYIQVCTFKQQIPKKEVETGFKYKPQ